MWHGEEAISWVECLKRKFSFISSTITWKNKDLQDSLYERVYVYQHQSISSRWHGQDMTLTCMQDGFCGVDLDREMMVLIVVTFELLNNSTLPDVPQFDLCQIQRTSRKEEQSNKFKLFMSNRYSILCVHKCQFQSKNTVKAQAGINGNLFCAFPKCRRILI